MDKIRIAIASDHGGYGLKQHIIAYLKSKDMEFTDFGTYSEDSVDYTDYALVVSEKVVAKEYDLGILICKTGIGMSIAANKVPGIRAAICHNVFMAKMAKEHNNANVIVFGAGIIQKEEVVQILDAFFNSEFQGGRHLKRLNKIKDIEDRCITT